MAPIPSKLCRECNVPLNRNSNHPQVYRRAEDVISYTDNFTELLSESFGFTQYFHYKVIMYFAKALFPLKSGHLDFSKEQDLHDYLTEGREPAVAKFLSDYQRLFEFQVERMLFHGMIAPDVWSLRDAGGRVLKYKWEVFEADLETTWEALPQFSSCAEFDDVWQVLTDLYSNSPVEDFFQLIRTIHSMSNQEKFWNSRSGPSIVAVNSKLGRRPPSWGWK